MSKWLPIMIGGGIAVLGGYAFYHLLREGKIGEKELFDLPPIVPPEWVEPETTILGDVIKATGVTEEYSTFGEVIEIPASGRKGDRIKRIIPPDPKEPPPPDTYRKPIPGPIPGLPVVGYYEIDMKEEKTEPKTKTVSEPKVVAPRTPEQIRLLR